MAIIKFMPINLWDDGTITASSEAVGFPATNTQHRWKTFCWRATGDAAEWIKINLGAAQNIKAFIIENHNFTGAATLKIQGNAADAWGAPAVDVTIPITAGTIVYFWDTNQNFQWWRISIADGANPDACVKIGRIFLGTYFEPARTYATHTVGFVDPSKIKKSTGGQVSANEKTHYKTISYGFVFITPADVDNFEIVYDKVGESKDYFICEDSANAAPYTVTFYVRNTSTWKFSLVQSGLPEKQGAITVETLR